MLVAVVVLYMREVCTPLKAVLISALLLKWSTIFASALSNFSDLQHEVKKPYADIKSVRLSLRRWRNINNYNVCRIFMKFGIGVLYRKLQTEHDCRENSLNDNNVLLTGSNKLLPVVHIYWPIWLKFGIVDLDVMPFSICDFRENRRSEIRNLLSCVNGFLSVFPTFIVRFGWNSVQHICT